MPWLGDLPVTLHEVKHVTVSHINDMQILDSAVSQYESVIGTFFFTAKSVGNGEI